MPVEQPDDLERIGPYTCASFDELTNEPYTHPLHFTHYITTADELDFVTVGDTRWAIERGRDAITILPPLLGGTMDNLTTLIQAIDDEGKRVHLAGFLSSEVRHLPLTFTHEQDTPYRIIQEIHAEPRYEKIAKRSKGRYTTRELDTNDHEQVDRVTEAWRSAKIEGYLSTIREARTRGDRERVKTVSGLLSAVSKADDPFRTLDMLEHPLMRHFGAYDGPELLAHTTVLTSDGIIAMLSRRSVREKPSPQEFLDAIVFETLRTEGYDRIERGNTTEPGKTNALLTYKLRFGDLELRREPDFFDVYPHDRELPPLSERMVVRV